MKFITFTETYFPKNNLITKVTDTLNLTKLQALHVLY